MHASEVREALKRQPFIPFQMRLIDGRKLEVVHPEYVAVARRRLAFFHHETEALSILEPLAITSLEYPAGTPMPPSEKRRDEGNGRD